MFYPLTRVSRFPNKDQQDNEFWTPGFKTFKDETEKQAYILKRIEERANEVSIYWQKGVRMNFSTITDLFFKDLEKARDFLKRDSEHGSYGLCECYYNYVVIEELSFVDDADCTEDRKWDWQEWYELRDNKGWVKIDRPEWAAGTVDFFG